MKYIVTFVVFAVLGALMAHARLSNLAIVLITLVAATVWVFALRYFGI